jgi:small subunit ribosomal protein S6
LREYETVFVLHPTCEEKEFEAEIQAVSDMITTSGGSVLEIDRWGRRRLAYDIKRVHEGIYALLRYRSDAAVLKEIERRFRMNERMLRHMTVISEGPLAPPRAEGAADGPGSGERKPHHESAGTSVTPDVSASFESPIVPFSPPAIEALAVPDAPPPIEAPVTGAQPAGETPAEPADGASL